MSIEQELGEAIRREVSSAYNSSTFGEGALRAVREIVPPERHGKLKDLDARALGEDLFRHVRIFNGQVLKAGGVYYVISDEYGDIKDAAPPHRRVSLDNPPAGLKTILKPEGVSAYLIQRLIYLGALPVPATPVEEIIADLGWEPEAAAGEEEEFEPDLGGLNEVVRGLAEKIPGLRVARKGEFELAISGEGKVKDCVDSVVRYGAQHLDQLEDLIREIWHAGNFCFNAFLLDEDRGERAALFAQVRGNLMEHGDSHVISMSTRSEEFRKQVLPPLLSIRNRCIGDA